MNVVAKALQTVWNPPATRVRGNEFEYFIREKLFPDKKFELLQKAYDYLTKNDFVEDSETPDFQFKSRRRGRAFFVEAKFRYGFYGGSIEWCQPRELKRYHEIDSRVPVYVVLGIGLHALAPQKLYLFPVKDIRTTELRRSFLDQYKISPRHSVKEKHLR